MKRSVLKVYYILLPFKNFLVILYNRLIAFTTKPPIVNSLDKTIYEVVNNRKSVSRYGDGEFSLMRGKNLLFQPCNEELKNRLREIIKSQESNLIICIPDVFQNIDWCEEKPKKYWKTYLELNRYRIYKMLDKKKMYYDALMTRLYIDRIDKYKTGERFNKLKTLWKERDVIIVEGNKSRLGVGNDLFSNCLSIKRVICPSINAYDSYGQILRELKKHHKNTLILIALGPTATVLAYDLAVAGYQAVDIGHIDIEYEWFLLGAKEKKPVSNKYIGEIPGGNEVGDLKDEKYASEIIRTVR
ncbi:SP_1767 family glycosyltransferase [Bacillus sp. AK128]